MTRYRFRFLISLLCVTALALGCISVSAAEGKKVTVMVYMCGSNLESENMEGTNALGQMIRSRFNKDEVNVAVMAGGSSAWNNGFDPSRLTLGELGNGRKIKTEVFPLAGMGDPETLAFFLKECAKRYPAEENILVFWDHGGGPAHGVCQDELFEGDTLSLTEIAQALQESPYADRGLDLIVFNACLMGSAELSVALAPYADYLVATEDSMYGLTYDWLSGVETRDPLETARMIVDNSFAFNQDVITRQNASEINSFSVVDLSKTAALSDAVDAFFTRVTPALSDGSFTDLSAKRRASVTFGTGESGNASGFDLVDLGDLVNHYSSIAPAEAEALAVALRDAVVYHQSADPSCTGLTVYHPFANKEERLLRYRIAVYNDLGFAPAYTEYIQSFSALLTGTRLADWSGLRVAASAKKDQRTLYTMNLSEEQAAHFGAAQLTALVRSEDDSYRFTWAGDQFSLENGVLTAEFVHNSLCVTDAEGNPVFNLIPYSRDARGHYLIPAELKRYEKTTEDGALPEVTHTGLISCAYDAESRRMQPGGVLIREEQMGGYTPAFNAAFDDYDEIRIFVPSRRETRDEEGVLLPFDQWTAAGEEVFSSSIDGSWYFALLPNLIEPADLYVAFDVTDSQNNHYFSDLLPASAGPRTASAVTEYDDANLVHIDSLSLFAAGNSLNLTMTLANLTETETIIALENLTLNGKAADLTAEAYGNGENWGLLPGESSILSCPIPASAAEGTDFLDEVTFDLTLQDAADPESILGTVPVKVTVSMDLSAVQ